MRNLLFQVVLFALTRDKNLCEEDLMVGRDSQRHWVEEVRQKYLLTYKKDWVLEKFLVVYL